MANELYNELKEYLKGSPYKMVYTGAGEDIRFTDARFTDASDDAFFYIEQNNFTIAAIKAEFAQSNKEILEGDTSSKYRYVDKGLLKEYDDFYKFLLPLFRRYVIREALEEI